LIAATTGSNSCGRPPGAIGWVLVGEHPAMRSANAPTGANPARTTPAMARPRIATPIASSNACSAIARTNGRPASSRAATRIQRPSSASRVSTRQ
jgi:hypothetical protein